MKRIDIVTIFDRMDDWRHLPSYQLERRADLFFALYLPEVLKGKLGFPFMPVLIPEFPVRIGTIKKNESNQSCKIDYIAFSKDADRVVFVELKTEGKSRRSVQDKYLQDAQSFGFRKLLEALLDIFRATNAKRKYFYLLEYLEGMGQLKIPPHMKEIMSRSNLQGVNKASREVTITTKVKRCDIVYIQPNAGTPDIISFDYFRSFVQKYDDPISKRFAISLEKWASATAGTKE